MPAPAAVAAPAAAPGAPTPHRPTAGRVVWEFEGNHGNWTPFHNDCQEFMERKYQEFVGGKGKGKGKPQSRINVKTDGKQISVDFEKLTSKVQDSHKIRSIRRQEG
jgi:hypothetical protein